MKNLLTKFIPLLLLSALTTGCYGLEGLGGEATVVPTAAPVREEENQGAAAPVLPGISPDAYPYVDGSAAALPLARTLAELCGGMSAEDAALYTSMSGTAEAYSNLTWGNADMLLAYEPSAQTLAALREQGVRLEMKPIALDALVFVVNGANPVANLTDAQLRAIYIGGVVRWSDVGGADAAIRAFQHDAGAGSQTLFEKLLMRGDEAATPQMLMQTDKWDREDIPADYDNAADALGFSQFYYVTQLFQAQGARMLSVDGVTPDAGTIRDGSYPYVARLYAVLREDTPQGSPSRALYDFLFTEEGRAMISRAGYIVAGE